VQCEWLGEDRYRVRDFWSGHREFETFRERFAEDFNQFERRITEELVEEQEFVGAYYEAGGDDLVSA
jgi:hypothetical protein